MTRVGALAFAALCSCAIDDRRVAVRPACVSPSPSGLLSDFSTARLGSCLPEACPDNLVGSSTVSLGTTGVKGLVFAYEKPASVTLKLGLTGDLLSARDASSALHVTVAYDPSGQDTPPLVAGVALRFLNCVDITGYGGMSFRVEGALGTCPMRVAATRDEDPQAAPCPLDECFVGVSVPVATGVTTVPLSDHAGESVFAGAQWELGLPTDGSKSCAADFTIDDLQLVAGP
jgi:hypothetical protein